MRHRPRNMRAHDLEEAVWDQVRAILTDKDYLLELAALHLAAANELPSTDDRRGLQRRLAELGEQKIRIVRALAVTNELETLDHALQQIKDEEQVLQAQLRDIDRRAELSLNALTVEEQLKSLAATARERMANPTDELMAELFDLLEIDMVRVDDARFEGTGSIPLPEDGGEVWIEGPQRP